MCFPVGFEAFQQPDSHVKVRELVERYAIDFVVVDEIHYSKQREADDMSRRRQMVTAMIQLAAERNPDIAVLGRCGLSFAPADAAAEGRTVVDIVLDHEGGHGAVREVVERLLKARGVWKEILAPFTLDEA